MKAQRLENNYIPSLKSTLPANAGRAIRKSDDMKKNIFVIFVLFSILFLMHNVYANNESESNTDDRQNESVEYIDENNVMNEITEGLETILEPDSNELEENVSKTMEKYSNNGIVRFFQKLIDAISSFIESIFKLASEAAKIGVD